MPLPTGSTPWLRTAGSSDEGGREKKNEKEEEEEEEEKEKEKGEGGRKGERERTIYGGGE